MSGGCLLPVVYNLGQCPCCVRNTFGQFGACAKSLIRVNAVEAMSSVLLVGQDVCGLSLISFHICFFDQVGRSSLPLLSLGVSRTMQCRRKRSKVTNCLYNSFKTHCHQLIGCTIY